MLLLFLTLAKFDVRLTLYNLGLNGKKGWLCPSLIFFFSFSIFPGDVKTRLEVLVLKKSPSSHSDYVGFTARHLHQRIIEHKYSAIGKHFSTAHGDTSLLKESQFRILKTCQGKFDCLVYEMLFIEKRNPSLNTQTDSVNDVSLTSKRRQQILICF